MLISRHCFGVSTIDKTNVSRLAKSAYYGGNQTPKMVNTMEQAFLEILKQTGEDPMRAGLVDTPKRAAKAMQFLTQGYSMDIDEVINNALFPSDTDEMVIVKNIELYSMCEHHMLPFIGKCHVAYIPNGKVIGLSKIARVVDVFARRLQIQENLTNEIANCIVEKTNAAGAAVIIEAQHMCMMMRGVEKQNSTMTTSCMLGAFRNSQSTRAEFLSLVK
jgi:GTP cyclohydrolase I